MPLCHDAALTYAARGWAVFPCQGKIPLTKHGFKDATTDPATIQTLFASPCNLAIRTGHGLCVLDLDMRPGKDGHETLHDWETRHAPLPSTRSVTTPSGGQHYYFTCATSLPCKTALGVGIDFKAAGGYVLAPPSEGYVLDQDVPLAPLPDWLLAKVTGKKLKLDAAGQIPPGTQDDQLHQLACSLTRQGLSPDVVRAGLKTALLAAPQDPAHPFTEKDIDRWIAGAQQFAPETPLWSQFHIPLTGKSQPICNAQSALMVLEQHPAFTRSIWFDTFSHRIMTTWETPLRAWHDEDTARLLVFLQRTLALHRMSKAAVEDAVNVFVATRTRHEVQDWLATLTWDGTARIETCFTTLFGTPDTEYSRAASRNFWLGLAARIYVPGCQMDHTVVLEGPQGQGKTSALRTLGGTWYRALTESVLQKDFFQLLPGSLIIEIAELDSFRHAEVARIKHVLSTPSDTYRRSYGRLPQTYHRQCVFVATTNEEHYLRDMTGARRFWPIACGTIDLPAITVQRDQLFAEAAALFKKGCTWWEMPTESTDEQEMRREVDAWETPIAEYLLLHDEVTLKDVLCDAVQVPLGQIRRVEQLRVSAILKKFGWKSLILRRGETTLRRWVSGSKTPGDDLTSGDFTV